MSFVDHWASGPRSVEIGRTPTEASRKCVATARKESIPPSCSSSSTAEFRGLEGSDTKAENWSATGNRQIVEDHLELHHPVSENKGPPDVPSVCSNADHSGPIDCEVLCSWSPIEITSCHLLYAETHVHRRGTTTTPPVALSVPSADLSRVPPPWRRITVALGSMWPKFLILPTSRGHMDLARKMIIENQLRLLVVSCLLDFV